jgi:nicotinate dehydrogenase large molybdopterin subunit
MSEAGAVDREFIPRPDAEDKLSGRAGYLTDLTARDMLHAAVLMSPHPHAVIRRIDVSAAQKICGVRAIITEADVPAGFLIGIRLKDQPVLARGVVRYIGEPIAVVAAETHEAAEHAVAAIDVEYQLLPVVGDPDRALLPSSPVVHAGGNLCHRTFYARGDLDAAFAAATHVIEDVYMTPRQMHVALELEGGLATPHADGRMTIFAPSQHPHGVRDVVAALLEWPSERVDLVGSPLGGGYGGREDVHVQPLIALAARKSGRPVRLQLSRPQSVAFGVKRHPFRIRMRTACAADGRLLAHEVDALADTGAYASHGPEVLDTAHECAQGVYRFEAVRLEGRLAHTNNGNAGAFRGFGALQMQMAVEMQIERLARRAGIDPVSFRRMNLVAADARGPLGQTILPQPELARVASRLADHTARVGPRKGSPRHLHGTGVSLVSKGEGFAAGAPNGAQGVIALANGAVEFRCGLAEMGQGVMTMMTAVLARELGVARADVRAIPGSTIATPDAGPTSASRGTQVASRLARAGAAEFSAKLCAAAAVMLGVAPERCSLGPGGVYQNDDRRNAPALSFGDLHQHMGDVTVPVSIDAIESSDGEGGTHKIFTTCGAVASVTIDVLTGHVTVEQLTVIPACGPAIAEEAFIGQVEGAAVMACGFALTERLPAVAGRYVFQNLDGYLVPTIRDAPVVFVDPVTELAPDDPIGLRGVGEIPLNAVGPAIASAVFDALGVAPTTFPISPEWVLEVLGRGRPA